MPVTTGSYEVRANPEVTLEVTIGDAQPGGSAVFLGTELVAEGNEHIPAFSIGKGRQIKGLRVVVSSVVSNENPATNNTSMTVELAGGAAPKKILAMQEASRKGERISYITVISFV